MSRDKRQGVYLIIAGRKLYVGSVAGKRRSFSVRWAEHSAQIADRSHPNDALRQADSKELRFIPLVIVRRGNIEMARKIEGILIRAIRGTCNERR